MKGRPKNAHCFAKAGDAAWLSRDRQRVDDSELHLTRIVSKREVGSLSDAPVLPISFFVRSTSKGRPTFSMNRRVGKKGPHLPGPLLQRRRGGSDRAFSLIELLV